jgi:hypothetical protein
MEVLLRIVLAVCPVLLVCFSACSTKYRAEEVMWTPRTQVGRQVKEELKGSFEQLIEEIQESPGLHKARLQRGGLMLAYRTEGGSDSALYLLLSLSRDTVYNTCGTSYETRAARAYSADFLLPLARVLCSHPEIFEHERIAGAAVALEWGAAIYLSDCFRLHANTERMNAWIPEQALFDFAQLRATIHELAEQTVFDSSQGPVELDFGEVP